MRGCNEVTLKNLQIGNLGTQFDTGVFPWQTDGITLTEVTNLVVYGPDGPVHPWPLDTTAGLRVLFTQAPTPENIEVHNALSSNVEAAAWLPA